jgi:peptidoglycan/LPS O-acetylase OafA/YrhL
MELLSLGVRYVITAATAMSRMHQICSPQQRRTMDLEVCHSCLCDHASFCPPGRKLARPQPMLAPARLTFIDSLRGCAALAVVLYHMQEGGHVQGLAAIVPGLGALFSQGHLGVQVFFVLSGFVVAHATFGRKVDAAFMARFILRRSLRLDPPYWASMALVIALGVLSTHFVPGKSYPVPSLEVLAAHVAYLPVLLNQPLVNTVYWTLCLEFQFYICYVLLLWVAANAAKFVSAERAFSGVLFAALLIADLWMVGSGPVNIPGLFLGHWFFFLSGVATWWAWHSSSREAHVIFFAQMVCMVGVFAVARELALIVTAGTAFAIYMAGRKGQLSAWLSARPILFLGTISYSLYLVHNPITGAAYRAGYTLTGRSPVLELLWSVIAILVCVIAATVFYRLFELPSMLLARRVKSTSTPADPAVIARVT